MAVSVPIVPSTVPSHVPTSLISTVLVEETSVTGIELSSDEQLMVKNSTKMIKAKRELRIKFFISHRNYLKAN
jgi:hypothetical protein